MKKYIYKITNLINGKMYVGQTNNPKKRERQHFSLSPSILEENNGKILYNAMLKYGIQNFSFEIIENECEDYNEREKYWIKKLNTLIPNGYNMTEGGDTPPVFQGEKHPMATHNLNEINKIKKLLINTSLTFSEIAEETNYSESSIRRINSGLLWYDENTVYPIRIENTASFKKERMENIVYDLLNSSLTQKDIAKKYNVSRTTITAINNGQNFYQDNIDYPIRKKDQHSKSIQMIDYLTGKTYLEFSNATEAAKYLNLPKRADSNIRACANGKIKTAYGYIWAFVN